MRVGDHVYFAPKILLRDLDLSNKDFLIDAFEKRMNSYFLEAIKLLNEQENAYGAAIIEFSMIDALAKYSIKKKNKKGEENRIVKILQKDFAINKELADKAYDEFRNGLLHENHIKEKGQLCYATSKAFELEEKGCLIVNPKELEDELKTFFQSYIENLKTDEKTYSLFLRHIKNDFEQEVLHFQSNEMVL